MESSVARYTYVGTFLTALSMLMFEILLTRIFTVTMLYHFAFVAISTAMFGMTIGSLIVYLLPRYFTDELTTYHLALSALWFSISMFFALLTYLAVPMVPAVSFQAAYTLLFIYVTVSIPFVFGGICICLILTRFPGHLGKLYAADLIGAATGCIAVIYFTQLTDGPSSIVIAAFLASIGALFFTLHRPNTRIAKAVLIWNLLLGGFIVTDAALSSPQGGLIRVAWVEGKLEPPGLYERWNSYSRLKVLDYFSGEPAPVRGWGLSLKYPRTKELRSYFVKINNDSGTWLTAFDGDLNKMDHLKYELGNLVHYIRPKSRILSIGVGGGIDVLSGLVFDQKEIVAVDLNGNLLDLVNRVFGKFTGRLDKIPGVRFVHDEARSYLAREKTPFDIIQARGIERPKAALGGAFVLSENGLYTVESWKLMLDRLAPNGVITFTRIHFPNLPHDLYRMTSLATRALLDRGVKAPREHIIVARLL
ncbi:MAG: hypothetical protein V2B18_01150, partial [Pseudomonadota bacterium]